MVMADHTGQMPAEEQMPPASIRQERGGLLPGLLSGARGRGETPDGWDEGEFVTDYDFVLVLGDDPAQTLLMHNE